MFELFFAFLVLAGLVGGIVLAIGLLKVGFEIALLPLTLIGVAIKAVLALVGVVLFLAVGLPLLIVGFVLFLPLLILGGILFGSMALVGVC